MWLDLQKYGIQYAAAFLDLQNPITTSLKVSSKKIDQTIITGINHSRFTDINLAISKIPSRLS